MCGLGARPGFFEGGGGVEGDGGLATVGGEQPALLRARLKDPAVGQGVAHLQGQLGHMGGVGRVDPVLGGQVADAGRAHVANQRRVRRGQVALEEDALAQAGEKLASSFGSSETLVQVARLAVPVIADGCILENRVGNGFLAGAAAHVDPRIEEILDEIGMAGARIPPKSHPLTEILQKPSPVLLQSDAASRLLEVSADPAYLKAVKAANTADAGAVMAKMRELPIQDAFVKGAHLRADGQVIQLPRLLYLIAEQADGQRPSSAIAESVSHDFGRGVTAENVEFLVDKKLRPLGVLAAADGSSPQLKKPDPMLALKFRAALIPRGIVNAVTTIFHPLFWPILVLAVVAGLIGLDAWLFLAHGVAERLRNLLNQPIFFLMVFGLVIVSAAFHECGHVTGLRYGGGKPGVMGAGLYIVWPAFYTDVTDAYRLGKGARLRTDLGGVYFNVVFMLLTLGAYVLTHFEPLLVVIIFQQFEMLHQFLPFLRLDGYYVISDLTGVPDIFTRIKPTLASLIPGRKPDKRVTELKPWVRIVVTLWVLATAVFILYAYGMMLLHLPRILGTAVQSLLGQIEKTSTAFQHGNLLFGGFGALQVALLILPLAGLSLTLGGRRLGAAVASVPPPSTAG